MDDKMIEKDMWRASGKKKSLKRLKIKQNAESFKYSSQQHNITKEVNSEDVETTCSKIFGATEKFSKDFLHMLNAAFLSDITIKSGKEIFKAHKIILSARSPVFKAMFSNSMQENINGTVTINDLSSEVVQELLVFIYSNEVKNISVPKACELLNAAEKYQMQSLKCVCVEYLIYNLSTENAILILQKADLYDKNLKQHAMDFICKKFNDLKGTEEFKNVQISNPTLALEVFNKFVGN